MPSSIATAHVTADQHIVAETDTNLPEGGIDEETYALDDDSIAEITQLTGWD